jgi:hypothetical protein
MRKNIKFDFGAECPGFIFYNGDPFSLVYLFYGLDVSESMLHDKFDVPNLRYLCEMYYGFSFAEMQFPLVLQKSAMIVPGLLERVTNEPEVYREMIRCWSLEEWVNRRWNSNSSGDASSMMGIIFGVVNRPAVSFGVSRLSSVFSFLVGVRLFQKDKIQGGGVIDSLLNMGWSELEEAYSKFLKEAGWCQINALRIFRCRLGINE